MRARRHNISVRLNDDQARALRKWALKDPEDRGMGYVLRRLIDEEMRREREGHEAANRAG